jgi:hypothetical protein
MSESNFEETDREKKFFISGKVILIFTEFSVPLPVRSEVHKFTFSDATFNRKVNKNLKCTSTAVVAT